MGVLGLHNTGLPAVAYRYLLRCGNIFHLSQRCTPPPRFQQYSPMNAPTSLNHLLSAPGTQPHVQERIREIPYNYTSFSDREIVIRLLGERG